MTPQVARDDSRMYQGMGEKMPSSMHLRDVSPCEMNDANYRDSPFVYESESVKRMAEKNGYTSVYALFLNDRVNHRIRNGIRS